MTRVAKPTLGQLANRGAAVAEQRSHATQAVVKHHEESLSGKTLELAAILDRPNAETRGLNAEAVVALAESMDALGLLEPIVVDRRGHLVAGGHRRAALGLLVAAPKDRGAMLRACTGKEATAVLLERLAALPLRNDLAAVPVRVLELDASTDEGGAMALAAEVAENASRRAYTPSEVRGFIERLRAAGFSDNKGRPRKGEKPLRASLAAILGVSVRHLRRVVGEVEPVSPDLLRRATDRLRKALSNWLAEAGEHSARPHADALLAKLHSESRT